MADVILENGKIIKCMEKERLLGQTVTNTTVDIKMIKDKDKGISFGPTVEHILANGIMGNNMGKEYIFTEAIKKEKAFGKRAKENAGLKVDENWFKFLVII